MRIVSEGEKRKIQMKLTVLYKSELSIVNFQVNGFRDVKPYCTHQINRLAFKYRYGTNKANIIDLRLIV
jgi:hypothetical protein